MTQSRTHTCNELRIENVGQKVKIVGWMENVREVGSNFAFVVVRDFYGGKLSFGTLRRCIAAWLYFKLYRMGGAAKKLGCKVCSKLAGGDLNV